MLIPHVCQEGCNTAIRDYSEAELFLSVARVAPQRDSSSYMDNAMYFLRGTIYIYIVDNPVELMIIQIFRFVVLLTTVVLILPVVAWRFYKERSPPSMPRQKYFRFRFEATLQ